MDEDDVILAVVVLGILAYLFWEIQQLKQQQVAQEGTLSLSQEGILARVGALESWRQNGY